MGRLQQFFVGVVPRGLLVLNTQNWVFRSFQRAPIGGVSITSISAVIQNCWSSRGMSEIEGNSSGLVLRLYRICNLPSAAHAVLNAIVEGRRAVFNQKCPVKTALL